MNYHLDEGSEDLHKKSIKKKRLLIVEDLGDIRSAYREIFERVFQIEEAEFSKDAMTLFHSFNPHVILLDGHLHEHDKFQGIQLLGWFKSQNPSIVVCVISADSSLKYAMLTKGADAFFDKPFDHDKVFQFLTSKGLVRRLG